MTANEFARLPALLTAGQVRALLGISSNTLRALRYPITNRKHRVPFGRLGAICGWHLTLNRKGPRHYRYRKADIAAVLGPPYTDL